MKRSTRHHHVLLDALGNPTMQTLEHEHPGTPGIRHAHYWPPAPELYRQLRDSGVPELRARQTAELLGDTAQGTLDFRRLPGPVPTSEDPMASPLILPGRPS